MKNVRPRECALAIALPLTRDRFLRDLSQPERYDYALYIRSLYESQGADETYYWDVVFEPFATAMIKRCESVARRGVAFVRDASLADVGRLLNTHSVVTLVAHWKFRIVRPEDIVDPVALLAALRNPSTRLQRAFAEAVERQHPGLIAESPDVTRLVDGFNDVLRGAHSKYSSTARGPVLFLEIPPVRLTRATLEYAFKSTIKPARAIELGDGMVTLDKFVDAIPVEFDGVLDLTVCNSAIIGEAIKSVRTKCLVAINRYPTEPHIRLARYRAAIESLHRRPAPFIDVITRFYD